MPNIFTDYSFETFIDETEALQTFDALYAALDRATGRLGYERLIFSIFSDPVISNYSCHRGVYLRDMDHWNEFYTQKNYVRIDPVVRALRSGAGAFEWSQRPGRCHLSQPQLSFMARLTEIGLHHGVGVPLGNHTAAIGLSTGDGQSRPYANLPLLQAVGTQFYQTFLRLHGRSDAPMFEAKLLTQTERDVLCWLRDGKTDDEIATIMSISSSTVDSHLRNIFRKLDAPNRLTAVLNGIRAGYVSL